MSAPILAATVIVLRPDREARGENYRLFLVQRHRRSGFMANAYVFPGGKVDPADAAQRWAPRVVGLTENEARDRLSVSSDAVAIYIAGLRETLEEANVFLATTAEGESLPTDDVLMTHKVEAFRNQPTPDGFFELVKELGLKLRLDWMAVWDHWITPAIEPKRFDTHFFVAVLPAGQTPIHDARETTDSIWLSPTEALDEYYANRLDLAPPTIAVVADLQRYKTVEAVFEQACLRGPCSPVLPVAVWQDNELFLLLPGDVDYPGSKAAAAGYRRAVLRNGRFYLIHSAPDTFPGQ